MGCCTSRPALQSAEAAHAASIPIPPNTSSITAINAPALQNASHHSRSASHVSNISVASNPHASPATASALRPNKPLRPPSPVPRCPPERALEPWTRTQLHREREAFFDTRVTGDPSIWSALRLICDMLRDGDVQGAQGMMDAAGLTCPTGRIKSEKPRGRGHEGERSERRKGGVYDEQGRGYDIPGWVVADPEDLLPDHMPEKTPGEEGESEDEAREKGKRPEGERVKVRARWSDSGGDVLVEIGLEQKVKVLTRKLQEKSGGRMCKVLYLGKILREDQTLKEQGWQEGHVVSAWLFD